MSGSESGSGSGSPGERWRRLRGGRSRGLDLLFSRDGAWILYPVFV